MLAGLIHDIGTLPICLYAEKLLHNLDANELESMIRKCRSSIGEKMLHAWGFPEELIEVVAGHENLQRETANQKATYTDIVTVANLLNRQTSKITAWDNVAAVQRLYLSPEVCQDFSDRFNAEIRATYEMLFPH